MDDPSGAPLSDEALTIYEWCLRPGPHTIPVLATRTTTSDADAERAVSELITRGLIRKNPDGAVFALVPRAAVDHAAGTLEHSAEWLRQRANVWQETWRQHHDSGNYIDVIVDEHEIDAVDVGIVESATHQIRALQAGTIGPQPNRPAHELNPALPSVTARGVEVRVVYGASVLSHPAGLAMTLRSRALGEQVRVFSKIPHQFTIVDDSRAVIAVAGQGSERIHLVVVRPSGLLDSLIDLFESYWQMSIPLRSDDLTDLDAHEAQTGRLLAYLSAGLTDESIARELGVSERTVGRRIAHLQERLGARSRFQLAVQSARRGWI